MATVPSPPTDVRERILRESTRLFATKGFDGTSLQDIAEAVGVRKPSLLYHFPSKDALRQKVLELMLARWNDVLPRVLLAATSSQGQFDGVLREMVTFFDEDPDRARLLLREVLDRPREMRTLMDRYVKQWVGAVAEYIKKGQERGRLWRDADPEAYVIQTINLIVSSIATRDSLGTLSTERNLREVLRYARSSLFRPVRRSPGEPEEPKPLAEE